MSNEMLASLSQKYPYPEDPCSLTSSFILLTRGPKSKAKFDIFNNSHVHFVKHHKISKAAMGVTNSQQYAKEFQAITWSILLKSIFSYFLS